MTTTNTASDYAINAIPEGTCPIVADGETPDQVADSLLDTYPPEEDDLDRDECRVALLERIEDLRA